MIQLIIPGFDESVGLTHIATDWQIARDVDFTDIVYEGTTTNEFKDMHLADVMIPEGEIFYGRARRIFEEAGSPIDHYLPYTKLYGAAEYDLREVDEEHYVETPHIYVDRNKIIDDNLPFFSIKSSKIRSKNSNHHSTTWVIYDDKDNVIFKNINDTTHKEYIEIDKESINLSMTSKLKISIAHRNVHGIVSKFCTNVIDIYNYKFDVISNLRELSTIRERRIDVEWDLDTEFKEFEKIEIIDKDNMEIKKIYYNVTTEYFIIPSRFLESGKYYIFRFYPKLRFNSGSISKDFIVTTMLDDSEFTIYRGFNYREKLESINGTIPFTRSNYYIEALDDNLLINVEVGGTTANLYIYDGGFVSLANGFEIDEIGNGHFNVFEVSDRYVLIDTINVDENRVFMVYKYDVLLRLFTHVSTTVISDDLIDDMIGTNAITMHRGHDWIYFNSTLEDVDGRYTEFRRFNVHTNVIETLNNRPDGRFVNGVVEYLDDGKILVMGGNDVENHTAYLYDVVLGDYNNIQSIPEAFRGIPIMSSRRKDGRLMFFSSTITESDKVLVYDDVLNEFIPITHDVDPYTPNSTLINFHNGDIIKENTDTNDYYVRYI